MRRSIFVSTVALLISVLIAGPALAEECTNASKPPAAGAQLILGPDFMTPIYISDALLKRIERGIIDFETGEGFHGIVAFDFDGDGVADTSTYFGVGPDGTEIPLEAQFAGPACHGLTNIGVYLTQCVGA